MLGSFDLNKTYQYLLISLAFLMPLTVSGANTIIVIICFLWLFSGDYKAKYNQIMSSKLMIASIVFYCLHVIGMLWTEDLKWGFHILHKMWYFLLLFPILFNIIQRKYIKYYISAFLLAIALTEIISYLVWFEIIAPFKNATVTNPTPFMSHISYNPILTLAIYIVYHDLFFKTNLSGLKFFFYSFFAITMTINMFITGGRAGQVAFFVMLAIIIFQFFNTAKVKSLLIVLMLIPGIFFTAYHTSDLFQQRVDDSISEILDYSKCCSSSYQNTSLGQRITFTINSWEVFKQNPIIGIGTGDFPSEYRKINQANTPSIRNTTNPHNMYILVLTQLGLIGLVSMLGIFYYQIKLSFRSKDRFFRDFGITLPLLFLVMMLSDSYLLGHYTTLMYIFFSAFLYKDFEKS
jgi:O-antigen ligase